MPDEHFEITITAKDAKNQKAEKHVEYRAVNATTPAEAAEELYRGLTNASKERCREISTDA